MTYLVQAVTRRKAFLVDDSGTVIEAQLRSSMQQLVCGDRVSIAEENGTYVVKEATERTNLLSRAYRDRSKLLAANIDMLFIVSAVKPQPNTAFIDRTIAACEYEGIPYSLVLNKSDLGTEEFDIILKTYRDLRCTVLTTCTKSDNGMIELENFITTRAPTVMTLCGLSGVGKSSIMNRLIPGVIQKTSEVSEKSGLGKQTTTMAQLYWRLTDGKPQYIIDLPGLQHFGITHIPLKSLRDCFQEFHERAQACQFQDCTHTIEPNCSILDALSDGTISQSRYNSYLHMREEIISAKPY